MTDGINTNRNYTDIRADVLKNMQGQDRTKGLRFADGRGIYVHRDVKDGGSLSRLFGNSRLLNRLFGTKTRAEKFAGTPKEIKDSINRQFGSVEIGGKRMNLGDKVFEHLGNPSVLTANDFKLIDAYISHIAIDAADNTNNLADKEMLHHTARMFDAASDGRISSEHLCNRSKYVAGAQIMRNALRADVNKALQARGVGGSDQLANHIIGQMGLALDSGLNMVNVSRLKELMAHQGIPADAVNELVPTARLEARFQATRKDMEALQDAILGADVDADFSIDDGGLRAGGFDPEIQARMEEVANFCDQGMKALEQHLAMAGAGGQKERDAIYGHFSRSYQSAMEFADQLEHGSLQQRELAHKLRQHASHTYDLAMSMNWNPAAPLSQRPSLHSPEMLNRPSSLHDHKLGPNLAGDQAVIEMPKTLYGQGGMLHLKIEEYNDAVSEIPQALRTFQENPTDGNLKTLHSLIEVASSHSDDLMLDVDRVSSRSTGRKGLMKNGSAADAESTANAIGGLKHRLSSQRKELQELKRMVGHVNDQRNAPNDLPDIHQADGQWRAIRMNQSEMRNKIERAEFAQIQMNVKKSAVPDLPPVPENQSLDDKLLDDEVEEMFGPGDGSDIAPDE